MLKLKKRTAFDLKEHFNSEVEDRSSRSYIPITNAPKFQKPDRLRPVGLCVYCDRCYDMAGYNTIMVFKFHRSPGIIAFANIESQ